MTMRTRRHAQRQRSRSAASSIDEIIEVRPRASELDGGCQPAEEAHALTSLHVRSHDSDMRDDTDARRDRDAKKSKSDTSNEDDVQEYKLTSRDYVKAHEFELSDDSYDECYNGESASATTAIAPEVLTTTKSCFHQRPWMEFDEEMRSHWEHMYASVTNHPLGGSWERAEDYQREKDLEMHRYLEDFAVDRWVVPLPAAKHAVAALQERDRWRSFGIPIFGHKVHLDMTNASGNTWRGATRPVAAIAHDDTIPATSESRYPTRASPAPARMTSSASFANVASAPHQSAAAHVQYPGTPPDLAFVEGLGNGWRSS